jgi:glycine/D-amino acid oxidase-like deaminating enzyme
MPSAGDLSVLHRDFKDEPYWWEAFRPVDIEPDTLPASVDVAIVGGGYAGLAAARRLADCGATSVVFEEKSFGSGASTRSGGALSAGLSVGKSFTGKSLDYSPDLVREVLGTAVHAYHHLRDLLRTEAIDCHYEARGRFLGACARSHYQDLEIRNAKFRDSGITTCRLVSREEQRAEIGTDFYHGGMVFDEAAKLHPALFYGGLLAACRRREAITLVSRCKVLSLSGEAGRWRIASEQGELVARSVIVATNGYTGRLVPKLRRRVVPVASHVIATDILPEGLATRICPTGRTFSETRRVLHYYRLSPDGRRVIFGGRSRFTEMPVERRAALLKAALSKRFPELADVKVTHSWQGNVAFTYDALPHAGTLDGVHFVTGCNGSGVTMMPYLGDRIALSIVGRTDAPLPFARNSLPAIPFYTGDPWFMPVIGATFRALDYIDENIVG